jgi:hypothetical protein
MDDITIKKINHLMEKYIKYLDGFEYGKDKDGNSMSYASRFIGRCIQNYIYDQFEASEGDKIYSKKQLDKHYILLEFVIDNVMKNFSPKSREGAQ